MLVALTAVAVVLVPITGAAVWLGLLPPDPGEHPNTGEYLVHMSDLDDTPVWSDSESAA